MLRAKIRNVCKDMESRVMSVIVIADICIDLVGWVVVYT